MRPDNGGRLSASGCDGWKPGVALEQWAQDRQGVDAVLSGGGKVGAHEQERVGALHGAPAARDLLLELDHAEIPLSLVVVKRHPHIVQEPQHLDPMAVQPVEQVGRG